MRLGIIGSRNFTNAAVVNAFLDGKYNVSHEDFTIVCSSGRGSDPIVHAWAKKNAVDVVCIRPYNFVDRKAPHRPDYFYYCNKQIIDNSDEVIVFYDNQEKCAQSSYEYAKQKGLHVSLVPADDYDQG